MRSQVRLCCSIGVLTSCRVWKTPSSNPSLSFPLKLWMQPFSHVDAGSMYSVLDPHHPGPFPRNPGRRLRPVARADVLSHAPDHRPAAEHLQHVGRPHAAAGPDGLTLPGAFADDRQQPCIYAVVESHLHEAACLKVVRPIGPQRRCSQRPPWSRLTGVDVRDGFSREAHHDCAPGDCRPAAPVSPGPDGRERLGDLAGTGALRDLAETFSPRLRRTGFSP